MSTERPPTTSPLQVPSSAIFSNFVVIALWFCGIITDIIDISISLYILACQHIIVAFCSLTCIVIHMTIKKPRILLTVDEKLIERIDDFRFGNRINSRSEAIRRLIIEALKKYEKKSKG